MKVMTAYKNGRLTITLAGELDHHGARDAVKKIEEVIEQFMPRDSVLDFSALSFMDSSGIAVILRVYKRMHELGGRAWIEGAMAQPAKVIDASGIDRMVPINSEKGIT